MIRATTRAALVVVAVASSVVLAQAQTPEEHAAHHPGSPETAQTASNPIMPSQGGGMPQMMAMRGEMGMPFDHIEGRIAFLKAEMKITEAQTSLWNAYADDLRTNASAMKAMCEHMDKDGMPTALPDRLAAQHKMMSAGIGFLNRLEAAARPLYEVLSTEQRSVIDQAMPPQ